MDLVVTYWDNIKKRTQVRYLDSSFMGHSTANDLLEHFSSKIDQFHADKLLQLSMDGPNVNWAFYDKVCSEREENELSILLNTGSCGLHVLHNAFKCGENGTSWKLKKTLKALYTILDESPARRSDYKDITGNKCQTLFEEITKPFPFDFAFLLVIGSCHLVVIDCNSILFWEDVKFHFVFFY